PRGRTDRRRSSSYLGGVAGAGRAGPLPALRALLRFDQRPGAGRRAVWRLGQHTGPWAAGLAAPPEGDGPARTTAPRRGDRPRGLGRSGGLTAPLPST